MIYSIVPCDQLINYPQDSNQERIEVDINGENVVLLKGENNTYTIERLISTNPRTYLNPELMPGTMIMTIISKKDSPCVKWEIINNGLELMRE